MQGSAQAMPEGGSGGFKRGRPRSASRKGCHVVFPARVPLSRPRYSREEESWKSVRPRPQDPVFGAGHQMFVAAP